MKFENTSESMVIINFPGSGVRERVAPGAVVDLPSELSEEAVLRACPQLKASTKDATVVKADAVAPVPASEETEADTEPTPKKRRGIFRGGI